MKAAIKAAGQDHDTLGGVFEVWAFGLPPGLGSHVSGTQASTGGWRQAIMGIQAIKGVEIGVGFELGARPRQRRRTTRSSTTPSAASSGAPTAPAASRAA